jgi:hypothetical protein
MARKKKDSDGSNKCVGIFKPVKNYTKSDFSTMRLTKPPHRKLDLNGNGFEPLAKFLSEKCALPEQYLKNCRQLIHDKMINNNNPIGNEYEQGELLFTVLATGHGCHWGIVTQLFFLWVQNRAAEKEKVINPKCVISVGIRKNPNNLKQCLEKCEEIRKDECYKKFWEEINKIFSSNISNEQINTILQGFTDIDDYNKKDKAFKQRWTEKYGGRDDYKKLLDKIKELSPDGKEILDGYSCATFMVALQLFNADIVQKIDPNYKLLSKKKIFRIKEDFRKLGDEKSSSLKELCRGFKLPNNQVSTEITPGVNHNFSKNPSANLNPNFNPNLNPIPPLNPNCFFCNKPNNQSQIPSVPEPITKQPVIQNNNTQYSLPTQPPTSKNNSPPKQKGEVNPKFQINFLINERDTEKSNTQHDIPSPTSKNNPNPKPKDIVPSKLKINFLINECNTEKNTPHSIPSPTSKNENSSSTRKRPRIPLTSRPSIGTPYYNNNQQEGRIHNGKINSMSQEFHLSNFKPSIPQDEKRNTKQPNNKRFKFITSKFNVQKKIPHPLARNGREPNINQNPNQTHENEYDGNHSNVGPSYK